MSETQTQQPEILHFDEYRQFCDDHTFSSRKIGLLSESLLHDAQQDERSISVDIDGKQIPAIVPISYVEGYDAQRSKELADSVLERDNETFYWCLPSVVLDESQSEHIAQSLKQRYGNVALYLEYSDNDTTAEQNLKIIEKHLGTTLKPGLITEPNAAEAFQEPGMYMHSFMVESPDYTPDSVQKFETPIVAFDDAVAKDEKDKHPKNGVALYDGSQVPRDLQDKLWAMYEQRFQWLGANHPISMEDTKEEFIETMSDPSTYIGIAFEDGEPACMGYIGENIDSFYWLNGSFLAQDRREGVKDLYFAGIVANLESAASHGGAVLNEIGAALLKTEGKYRVLFESTNLSEAYIPKMTRRAIEKTGLTCTEEKTVDVTHYRVLGL